MSSRPITKALAIAIGTLPVAANAQDQSPNLSFYGLPGLIDMPTATAVPDGQLSLTYSDFGDSMRQTMAFQITPRLTGVFRYSGLYDFSPAFPNMNYYDRSFDVRYQLRYESDYLPAIAIGLQDIGGTSVYAGEYLVASKTFLDSIEASVGLGWGRYGSYNGFSNPLSFLGDGWGTRTINAGRGGVLDPGQWFHGDAAFFGGVKWQATDKLSFMAEYSSDAYTQETAAGLFTHKSPINVGASYRFDNGVDVGAYYMYGSEVGLRLSYTLNPKYPALPTGREGAPPPVYDRNAGLAAGWSADWIDEPEKIELTRTRAADAIRGAGMDALAVSLDAESVTVHLDNGRYLIEAEAIGRTARALTEVLPASVETIRIVPVAYGMPMSEITIQRRDLEELENTVGATAESLARVAISDATGNRNAAPSWMPNAYPDLSYSFGSYLDPALFDPDNPFRADVGAEFNIAYTPAPGFVLSSKIRQPVIGNLDTVTRPPSSALPHVRTDYGQYAIQSETEIKHLTAEYFFRPGTNLYGRATVGYLETMYGGVSGELLWKPTDSRLALGAELNYAKKRDFDQLFGFQNYDVITGHASAYYDFGNGFVGQVDAGRYLAGDWGATFTLDREFKNGFKMGAYLTLTDVPASLFGEGSFDKGIRITIPLTWLSGDPSRTQFSTSISPTTRDGGARLNVRNRLYELVSDYHEPSLADSWGRFWR